MLWQVNLLGTVAEREVRLKPHMHSLQACAAAAVTSSCRAESASKGEGSSGQSQADMEPAPEGVTAAQ